MALYGVLPTLLMGGTLSLDLMTALLGCGLNPTYFHPALTQCIPIFGYGQTQMVGSETQDLSHYIG